MTMPPRAKILVDAVKAVTESREKTYGDPKVNLSCAGELKRVLLRYLARSARQIGAGEHEALDQTLSKIARIATGPDVHEDNYTDAAAYMALAAECAILGSHVPSSVMAHEAAEEVELDERDLSADALLGTEGRQSALSRRGPGSRGDDAGGSVRGLLREGTAPDAPTGGNFPS